VHERFRRSCADASLLTPDASAAALLGHLLGRDGRDSFWPIFGVDDCRVMSLCEGCDRCA
jgi:hypothetical protein